MRLEYWLNLLIILLFISHTPQAHAHKIKLFATAVGDKIEGYVYFPGGERAQAVTVKIAISEQQLPETVTTNDHGEFQFQAQYRTTHHLIADLGEGHRAEYTINSNELSDSLPAPATAILANTASSPPPAAYHENLMLSEQQLNDLIEKNISKQLKPLREQLEAYQEKIWLHDILGGIGYIFGVMGLWFYMAKSRHR